MVISESQQKIVPLGRYVAAVLPEPYVLTPEVSVNIRSTLEGLRPDLPPDAKLEDLLDEIPGRFLSAAGVEIGQVGDLQLKVIGYSDVDRTVKTVIFDGLTEPVEKHSTREPGIDWYGFVDVASRLVKGRTAFEADGVEPGPEFEYHIPCPLMSLEDAVELAETLVRTTATMARYVSAVMAPGHEPEPVRIDVGGTVHSAVVQPMGFSWVTRPRWVARREALGDSGGAGGSIPQA